jgi:hypothetical protein
MIVLIHRTYMVRRARISSLGAAALAAVLLAGCGSNGGGSPAAGGSGAGAAGGRSQPSSSASGSSGGGQGSAAGSVVQSNAGGVISGAAGAIVQTGQPKVRTAPHGVTQGAAGSILGPGQAQHASKGAPGGSSGSPRSAGSTTGTGSKSASKPTTSSKPKTTKPATEPTKPATEPTKPATHTTEAPTPPVTAPPKVEVRTVTVTKIHTKIKTVVHVRTVIHTVTTNIPPKVPAAAFMPSKHPVLVQHSFLIAGGNVGCDFVGNGVRCAVQRRVWAAPVPPANCTNGWGDTIAVIGNNGGSFVCGGRSPIVPDAKVIPSGWDDKIGTVTCEVRSFGVDCFSSKNRGFIISRTGYTLY